MAAPLVRSIFRFSGITRRISTQKPPLLLQRVPGYNLHAPNFILRTVSQEKAREGERIFYKTIAQLVALFVFMGFASQYLSKQRVQSFIKGLEPRRDKKRRKLALERTASEGIEFYEQTDSKAPRPNGFLPSAKAAEVVEGHEGIGYVPPRSKRFNFIADAVQVAAPAVVYIEIHGRHPLMRGKVPISNGSGFIVSSDGLILTNAHVVANRSKNQEVKVKLYDGRIINGRVIAIDSVSDLAAVKIDTNDKLPTLRMGKSSKLRPGEWVIAMGSPLALSDTITAGIVSTTNRTSQELGLNKNIDYIQTDASINMGNSGGPLVNLDGEAIGINTMMVTAGISFAIPTDHAKEFLNKVKNLQTQEKGDREKGSPGMVGGFFGAQPGAADVSKGVKRGYIGITMLTLSPPILRDLRQRARDFPDVTHGVLVYRIVIGSPAEMSGVKAGDVITHIDSQEIKSAEDVFSAVRASKPITLTVVRGSQVLKMKVNPEEAQ